MRRRKAGWKQKLIDELRNHVKFGRPHGLTFKPCGRLTKEQVAILQDSLDKDFRVWADTWIFPWINQIEQALCPPTKAKAKP